MNRFDGKVALVTGASSGLGAATAQRLAAEGATVFAVARRADALQELVERAQSLPGEVLARPADLTADGACAAAVADCLARCERLDVLVNVAGSHRMRHSTEVSEADWAQDLALNLTAPFLLCREALPALLASGGNIVNVASIAGVQGQAYSAGYCAAKHGLIGLTRALAIEYSRERLRVNAVCPGGMDTPAIANFSFPEGADIELVMRSSAPRGMMAAEDVAAVIAFLASDDAAAIHGAVQMVDAGKTVG